MAELITKKNNDFHVFLANYLAEGDERIFQQAKYTLRVFYGLYRRQMSGSAMEVLDTYFSSNSTKLNELFEAFDIVMNEYHKLNLINEMERNVVGI